MIRHRDVDRLVHDKMHQYQETTYASCDDGEGWDRQALIEAPLYVCILAEQTWRHPVIWKQIAAARALDKPAYFLVQQGLKLPQGTLEGFSEATVHFWDSLHALGQFIDQATVYGAALHKRLHPEEEADDE